MKLQPSILSVMVRRFSAPSIRFLPSLYLAMMIPAANAAKPVDAKETQLDWIPIEQLTPEQRKQIPTACCGAYIAPERTDEEADLEPEEANLFGSADSSESDLQSSMVLKDNVVLRQGSRSISTDLFKLNQETSDAELVGNIQMREPGMLVRAEHAALNIQNGEGKLTNAEFVMYETRVRGKAESLEKFKNNVVVLNGSMVTGCEPGDNTWSIHGKSIEVHNDERYGIAKHMRLNIKDVPVFYFPYVRFPVGPDRLTGFLFPSLSINSDGIDDFRVPFYWNIAPNMDATITPRYMEERGYLLYSEFRHMSRHFYTEIEGSYLFEDETGLVKRERDKNPDDADYLDRLYGYKGQSRWQYQIEQKGGLGQRWKTEIDYADVSDIDYVRDIDRGSVDLNRSPYLRQKLLTSYRTDNWALRAYAQELLLLNGSQVKYSEMPRINANGNYRTGDWVVDLKNEYVRFDLNSHYEDDPKSNVTNIILGQRFYTDYNIGLDKEYTAGFIRPRIGAKTLSFKLDDTYMNQAVDTSHSYVTPQASLDTGLYFERELFRFDENYTQTLEPRIFYLWRDYEDQSDLTQLYSGGEAVNFDSSLLSPSYQQLFRDSRFSGGDRLDDTHQVTIGLASRFIENASGIERLRVGVGQIIYFKDRDVHLNYWDPAVGDQIAEDKLSTAQERARDEYRRNRDTTSMLAGYIGGQIGDYFTFSNDITIDPQNAKVQSLSTTLRYMDDQYRILNVGYRYSLDRQASAPIDGERPYSNSDLNQIDISTIWPVNDQWAAIARINYDINYDAYLDTFVGMEYDDCCYRVRVMARRWVDYDLSGSMLEELSGRDYDRGIFLELQLKGIGTISRKIGRLLDKAVYGYSEREESLQ